MIGCATYRSVNKRNNKKSFFPTDQMTLLDCMIIVGSIGTVLLDNFSFSTSEYCLQCDFNDDI